LCQSIFSDKRSVVVKRVSGSLGKGVDVTTGTSYWAVRFDLITKRPRIRMHAMTMRSRNRLDRKIADGPGFAPLRSTGLPLSLSTTLYAGPRLPCQRLRNVTGTWTIAVDYTHHSRCNRRSWRPPPWSSSSAYDFRSSISSDVFVGNVNT